MIPEKSNFYRKNPVVEVLIHKDLFYSQKFGKKIRSGGWRIQTHDPKVSFLSPTPYY